MSYKLSVRNTIEVRSGTLISATYCADGTLRQRRLMGRRLSFCPLLSAEGLYIIFRDSRGLQIASVCHRPECDSTQVCWCPEEKIRQRDGSYVRRYFGYLPAYSPAAKTHAIITQYDQDRMTGLFHFREAVEVAAGMDRMRLMANPRPLRWRHDGGEGVEWLNDQHPLVFRLDPKLDGERCVCGCGHRYPTESEMKQICMREDAWVVDIVREGWGNFIRLVEYPNSQPVGMVLVDHEDHATGRYDKDNNDDTDVVGDDDARVEEREDETCDVTDCCYHHYIDYGDGNDDEDVCIGEWYDANISFPDSDHPFLPPTQDPDALFSDADKFPISYQPTPLSSQFSPHTVPIPEDLANTSTPIATTTFTQEPISYLKPRPLPYSCFDLLGEVKKRRDRHPVPIKVIPPPLPGDIRTGEKRS